MIAARNELTEFNPMQAKGNGASLDAMLQEPDDLFVPPFPQKLEDLGVHPNFLADLALKALTLENDGTSASIGQRLALPTLLADLIVQRLYQEKLIEIRGVVAPHNHRVALLDRGWETVLRVLKTNRYTGPAPVSLATYTAMINQQVRSRPTISQHALEKAMNTLVLSDAARQTLGLVASSGRSLFLSGPPGNGKTAIAHALVDAIPGHIWIPHAVEVDNQVIQLFDHHSHQPLEIAQEHYDRRWVKIRPPLIVAGGELTIDNLDLVAGTENGGYYEAPLQMRANGGVLVVDDLGRQRCSATELLNRWIVPLEMKHDYLTLNTGKKICVPFTTTVVFATNLTVSDLADEAFLRRMGYRLFVMPPSPDTYATIFMRYARTKGLHADFTLLAHLESRYTKENRIPKACEPRDLIDRSMEACRYRREKVVLSTDSLDVAWNCYFGASASG